MLAVLSKVLAIVVGVVLGAAFLLAGLGLGLSVLVVIILAVTVLLRRDWVPVIYNLRSLAVRKVTTAVTVAGLALVVAVFAAMLILNDGIRTTLAATGDPMNAKVIRKGSQVEMQSGVQPEHLRLLSGQPEVALGPDGKAWASAEVAVLIYLLHEGAKDDTDGSNLSVRGVGPAALGLHPPAQLEGRMFRPGTSEVVVGKALVGRFAGARIGTSMRFARRDWTVVGVMDQRGSAFDSEVWGDVDQMLDAFSRRPAFSSITLRMKDADGVTALARRMETDPQLNTLEISTERRYWEKQSEALGKFVTFLGTFVAIIFAIGAVLGAMITMYAQVSARTREIGALRAMGFRRRAVLVSFVVESVILGLVGGVFGLGAASLMQLKEFSTTNFQTFNEVVFRFHLTIDTSVATMLFAAVMGFAGGLLPALRAARMPITRATRGG